MTDDEVMRVLERADPARVDDALPMSDAAAYLDGLRTRSTSVTLIVEPAAPDGRHRWPIIAAAAVVAIVLGGVVLAARDESETEIPAAPPTAVPSTTAATPSGLGEVETAISSPINHLKDWTVARSDELAFVVSSPTPSYWRLAALPGFDGTTWGLPESLLTETSGPLPPGSEPGVDGATVSQTFEIIGLHGSMLPAAFTPVRIEGLDHVGFLAEESMLVTMSATADGLEYTVDSVLPTYDAAELRAADAAPTGALAERHLELPADFPAELVDLARLITADAPTRYDQALALQNWFRDFTYDLSFPAGHSEAAMVEFVAQRRGDAEQFASTYAALARAVGLPSRVAVGFTPGEQGADGRYYVRGRHAHAWVEIYFEGIGWVLFEPTPQRGSPAATEYGGVPAAQDDGGR